MRNKSTKGFSLIELMVVIAIVAVLAAIAAPMYKKYLAKAEMGEVYNIIKQTINRWTEKNSTESWIGWGGGSPGATTNREEPYIDYVYMISTRIVVVLRPNYFDRDQETYVTYYPVVDGQSIDPGGTSAQLTPNAVISWECTISGPAPSSYYGVSGITIEEFRDRYFPDCGLE